MPACLFSNAKTISGVRSKKPISLFQLTPHLQWHRPINCCFIFRPQFGQARLLPIYIPPTGGKIVRAGNAILPECLPRPLLPILRNSNESFSEVVEDQSHHLQPNQHVAVAALSGQPEFLRHPTHFCGDGSSLILSASARTPSWYLAICLSISKRSFLPIPLFISSALWVSKLDKTVSSAMDA